MKKRAQMCVCMTGIVLAALSGMANAGDVLPHREMVVAVDDYSQRTSPSIVELPGGELFVVWYGNKVGGTGSVIYGARKPKGAKNWSAPFVVQDDSSEGADKNPTLYLDPDNKLWLFWTVQMGSSKWNRDDIIREKASVDGGYTWTAPHDLKNSHRFLTRTAPVRLHNGWVLLPVYADWSASAAVLISKDGCRTWEGPRYILPFFGIQPTIIERSDHSLFTLMRTGMPPRQAWQAESRNGGYGWWNFRISRIKNPSSSLMMTKLRNGHVVLAFNDSKTDRYSLSLALSTDEGKTWPYVRVIDGKPNRLYSYPSIVEDENGLIHVVYSSDNQSSIAHFVADEKWIRGNEH